MLSQIDDGNDDDDDDMSIYYHYRLLRRSSTNTQETHRNMTHGRKTIVVIQDETRHETSE